MSTRKLVCIALASVAAFIAWSPAAQADSAVMGGARVGYVSEPDAALVGGELLVKVVPDFYFNPNVEYVFQDDNYVTANADFHYDFLSSRRSTVWAGAGLGVVSVNPEGPPDRDTDAGLNVLLGAARTGGDVIPYVQAKVVAKDDSEFFLALGLRF